MGENILEELLRQAGTLLLRFQQGAEYLLFAADGFTPEIEQRAVRKRGVHLISVGDLLGIALDATLKESIINS